MFYNQHICESHRCSCSADDKQNATITRFVRDFTYRCGFHSQSCVRKTIAELLRQYRNNNLTVRTVKSGKQWKIGKDIFRIVKVEVPK